MSCRVAMLRMHRDGLIQLPPPQQACYNGRAAPPHAAGRAPIADHRQPPGVVRTAPRPVAKGAEAALWREYVDRYHYLGYTPLAGAQLRSSGASGPQVLACWGLPPAPGRWRRATSSSAGVQPNARPACNSWQQRPLPDPAVGAGQKPRLLGARAQLPPVAGGLAQPLRLPSPALETFVQSDRFVGTSYRAANWVHVGQTQGARQTRCPQPTRSAQEGHLALSAPPGFPPPPLRPARSSLQPVDRIFTTPSFALSAPVPRSPRTAGQANRTSLSLRGPHWLLVDLSVRLIKTKPLGTECGIIVLALILVSIFADVLAAYPYDQIRLQEILQPPSAQHLLDPRLRGAT